MGASVYLKGRETRGDFAEDDLHLPGVFQGFAFRWQTFVRQHGVTTNDEARQLQAPRGEMLIGFVSLDLSRD